MPLWGPCTFTPPRSNGSIDSPVMPITAAGPDTNAVASAVNTTKSANPISNAGPAAHGPITASAIGTMPEAFDQRRRDASPRDQRCHAVAHIGAGARELADDRHTGVGGEMDQPRDGVGFVGTDRAAADAFVAVSGLVSEAEPPDALSAQLADFGLRATEARRAEREQTHRKSA